MMGAYTVSGAPLLFLGAADYCSNFYPYKMYDPITGLTCQNSETLYQAYKAIVFKDYDSLRKILEASGDPLSVKKLSRKIRPFDKARWDLCKDNVMRHCLHLKFRSSSPGTTALGPILQSTADRPLIEASPYDRYWGAGLEKNTLRQGWVEGVGHRLNGSNRLGELLMDLRSSLQHGSNTE